jgi:hypothetical protein
VAAAGQSGLVVETAKHPGDVVGVDVGVLGPAAHDGVLCDAPSECGQRTSAVREDQAQSRRALEQAGVQAVGDVASDIEREFDDGARAAEAQLVDVRGVLGVHEDRSLAPLEVREHRLEFRVSEVASP